MWSAARRPTESCALVLAAGAAGGNALLTSTRDLSRFLHALLAGRLFRHPQTAGEVRDFVAAQDETGRVGYGLGLERYVLADGTEVLGHMGTAGCCSRQSSECSHAFTNRRTEQPAPFPTANGAAAPCATSSDGHELHRESLLDSVDAPYFPRTWTGESADGGGHWGRDAGREPEP